MRCRSVAREGNEIEGLLHGFQCYSGYDISISSLMIAYHLQYDTHLQKRCLGLFAISIYRSGTTTTILMVSKDWRAQLSLNNVRTAHCRLQQMKLLYQKSYLLYDIRTRQLGQELPFQHHVLYLQLIEICKNITEYRIISFYQHKNSNFYKSSTLFSFLILSFAIILIANS